MMLVMVSICAMAGSDIKFKNGDKKFFKTAEGTAALELVWTGCTYDDKIPVEKKFVNIDFLKKIAWSGFKEDFNNKSKKVKIVDDKEGTNYTIVVNVKKIDQFYNPMGFVPGTCTKMWGTIVIKDAKDNVLMEVEADGVDGGTSLSTDECFSDCFEELGKQFAKFK